MNIQICKNCKFYTAYYKKWNIYYSKLIHGYCSKHKKPQAQSETCNVFKINEQKDESIDKMVLISLEQALKSINEIAQILKENNKS